MIHEDMLAVLLERSRPGAQAGQRLLSATAWNALQARLRQPLAGGRVGL